MVARHRRAAPARHTRTGRSAEVAEETLYGLVGIGGESRSGDANGQYIKVGAGGGTNTVTIPRAAASTAGHGRRMSSASPPFPLQGAIPKISDSAKTPFSPDIACETQDQPDLGAGIGVAAGAVERPGPVPGGGDRRRRSRTSTSTTAAGARRTRPRTCSRTGARTPPSGPSSGSTRRSSRTKLGERREDARRAVAASDRDPQAAPELPRDHGAVRDRDRDDLLHPPGAAAPDPDPRGAAVRDEGRVRDGAGGRPRPGPDDPGRGRPRRRRHRASRSRTARASSPSTSTASTCRSTRTRRS